MPGQADHLEICFICGKRILSKKSRFLVEGRPECTICHDFKKTS
jgi:hypothetical protein